MKSFWKLFFHAMPLGLGVVLSLISIAFTTKVISNYNPEDEIRNAIGFGIIGFPMVVASVIRFTKKFNEN
ncbi:MAG: hypothetical protein JSV50_01145 [Desulfobacteraceae bacterium]|nr:MAG: hypothetical protein JSV50_01145 [Desulfobacteraceae bacterium]